MKNILLILLATIIIFSLSRQASAEEITLFDFKGKAIAYIDTSEEFNIYLWSGDPVAYLEDGSVWGFNGKHLGWLEKGVIRDRKGYAVGCVEGAIAMQYGLAPYKNFKKFVPFKNFQEFVPLRPLDQNRWSGTPLSLFLSLGKK